MDILDADISAPVAFDVASAQGRAIENASKCYHDPIDRMVADIPELHDVLSLPLRETVRRNWNDFAMAWSTERGTDYPEHDDGYPRWPLLSFPVAAGHLANAMLTAQLTEIVNFCNHSMILLATAHLYRACLASGMMTEQWEDMEYVISKQGPAALGLVDPGGSPTPLLHAAKLYGIALGVEVRHYGKKCKRVHLPRTEMCRRLMPKMTTVSGRPSSAGHAYEKNGQAAWAYLHRLAREKAAKALPNAGGGTRKHINVGDCFSDELLLTSHKAQLIADEMHDKFDYIGLFVNCATILKSVQRRLEALDPFVKQGLRLHETVDELLWNSARPTVRGGVTPPGVELLAVEMQATNHRLPDWQTDCVRKARYATSGSIPDELTPKNFTQELEVFSRKFEGLGARTSLDGSRFTMEDQERSEEDGVINEAVIRMHKEQLDMQKAGRSRDEISKWSIAQVEQLGYTENGLPRVIGYACGRAGL